MEEETAPSQAEVAADAQEVNQALQNPYDAAAQKAPGKKCCGIACWICWIILGCFLFFILLCIIVVVILVVVVSAGKDALQKEGDKHTADPNDYTPPRKTSAIFLKFPHIILLILLSNNYYYKIPPMNEFE